ncbi:MAG: fasciclin domain-containing protein [Bacteroidaceae bacterium]|nr:fasciclin domain-containing protein [Bacteroidaceae bacterium]MBO7112094.1 fasciclin domain-containing protein [Bacteroidaceae bacterium]
MKINRRLIKKSALTIVAAAFLGMGISCTDIWSEQHPGTYYTSSGETIADFLTGTLENHGDYSYFISILQKAELWGQMRTYGTYTCFAPDNKAVQDYIDLRRDEARTDSIRQVFTSIETVLQNRRLCDTLARTHLFNNTMYASDLSGSGVLQHPNMLDRYITYNSIADSSQLVYDYDGNPIKAKDGSDSVMVRLKYLINMQAVILEPDDSVENGVVHVIDRVIRPSNQFLPGLIKENPNLTIFYDALINTRLVDAMDEVYYDETYPEIEYEWTVQALRDNYAGIHHNKTSVEDDRIAMPEKREFKFTMFVMPDTALANYADDYTVLAGLNGIHDYADLKAYAAAVYPEGKNDPDTAVTSSIYRLVAYHILPCWLSYDQFNTSQADIIKNYKGVIGANKDIIIDPEDFFETMLPHSIMRISSPYIDGKRKGIYINRKGYQGVNLEAEGIRIAETADEYNLPGTITNLCINGGYHYINKLLVYDDFTRNVALQTRMRIMCCTLSPDFINSGGRGRFNGDPSNGGNANLNAMVFAYKEGYCTNFQWVPDQTRFYVRYRDKGFGTFNGDEITVRGSYDLTFKLPPVPSDGNYEIRAWNNANQGVGGASSSDRGVVQFYFHQAVPSDKDTYWRNWDWVPEDIPVDLRLTGDDARIGRVPDNDSRYDGMTAEQKELAIQVNDRAMRIRGFMQGMDSYGNGSNPLRDDKNCYRKIICNEYLRADNDYYIRMRQVFDDDGVFPFSFIEIVPKSIYEGNEDRH